MNAGGTSTPAARWWMAGAALLLGAMAMDAGGAFADSTVRVESMGVGGWFRPGTPVPLLVEATADVDQAAEAEVTWELAGPDGDTLEVSRRVIVEPGRAARTWLYATPLEGGTAEFAESTVRLWSLNGGVRGRELARTRFAPDALRPPVRAELEQADLALVIGTSTMGIEQFDFDARADSRATSLNGPLRAVTVDDPARLPDRAIGLACFGTVVVGNVDPRSFPPAQAAALLDWTRRGGHLVIVPTGADDSWGLAEAAAARRAHPFRDVMPGGTDPAAERVLGIRVAEIIAALSPVSRLNNQAATTDVWLFDRFDPAATYQPLAALPCERSTATGHAMPRAGTVDGRVYAIRRALGSGAVTIIGLDVDGLSRRALQSGGLPRAGTFWGPILGRRGDTLTRGERDALARTEPPKLVGNAPSPVLLLRGVVSEAIDTRSGAVVGVLAAFLLFVVYWAVAVPGSYFLLRHRGRVEWAWAAYAGIAIAFCGIAWLASAASEVRGSAVHHLTILDAVAGAGSPSASLSARGWASVPIEGYGRATVALGGAAPGDSIRGFEDSMDVAGYPDRQVIRQSCSDLGSIDVPARSTSTLVQFDAVGAMEPGWQSAFHNAGGGKVACEVFAGTTIRAQLTGTIVHSLPAPMEDVYIVFAAPVRPPAAALVGTPPAPVPSGPCPVRGTLRYLGTWAPGEPLDLQRRLQTVMLHAATSDANDLAEEIDRTWCEPLRARNMLGPAAPTMGTTSRLAAASLYGLLAPPRYLRDERGDAQAAATGSAARITRDLAHAIDLSHHAAGGALIIIGSVSGSCPVRLEAGGEALESSGTTLVRLIIPLGNNGSWLAPALPPQGTAP